jgi:hypothetical protein
MLTAREKYLKYTKKFYISREKLMLPEDFEDELSFDELQPFKGLW